MSSRFLPVLLSGFILVPSLPGVGEAEPSAIYKDPGVSVEQRVADLMSRMSLQDKIEQLHSNDKVGKNFVQGAPTPDSLQRSVGEGVGEVTGLQLSVEEEIPIRNAIQKYLLEQTPLGIPVIFHGEACHGLAYWASQLFAQGCEKV